MSLKLQMVLLTAVLLLTSEAAAATKFIVGGESGWTLPTDENGLEYTAWANTTTFEVGDSLVFTYNPSFHNVLSVSGAAFKACDTSGPLDKWADGNSTITFETEGRWWFLCGTPTHCSKGQAFKVTVNAASAPGPQSGVLESPASPPETGAGNRLIISSKTVVILASILIGVSLL